MTSHFRVVVADDHELVRSSIEKLLDAAEDFEVVEMVATGDDAVAVSGRLEPDLVLLDISMPSGQMDGLAAAAEIRRQVPGARIVLLTMHSDDVSLRLASELGVDGYLSKTTSMDDILDALRTVMDGSPYVSPDLAIRMMQLARDTSGAHGLTDRELEILRSLASGLRIQEIADALFLSTKTVKNHLSSIYAKLNVATASQAVAKAYQSGLVTASR